MIKTYKITFDHNGRHSTFIAQGNCPEAAEERFRLSAYAAFPIISIEVVPKRGARA